MTKSAGVPAPKMAKLKTIYDPVTAEPLDKGIVLWFPGPRSFTGEDVCELHVHGSKAVIRAILLALSKLKNFRPAEPGEFTKRAFYANKFDLTEVEGLSDLIDAETEMQRKQALYQMEGSLKKIYLDWRAMLLQSLAHVEAYIDFSEDENIEENILNVVQNRLEELTISMRKHLSDFRKGEILRDGIKTVIIGSPNVGKSSLLNVFCQKPAAIVTELAGTTRDVIESSININGYPVVIADTAGIRKQGVTNIVEKEGIRRSIAEAGLADLLLLVIDARDAVAEMEASGVDSGIGIAIRDRLVSYCDAYKKRMDVDKLADVARSLIVFNKSDLLNESQKRIFREIAPHCPQLVLISCQTEEGIADLLDKMCLQFHQLCGMPDKTNPSCTRARHRHHLQQSVRHIDRFLALLKAATEENVLFAAEELRSAAKNLGMITGTVATEEILDTIFKNFCVGK
ncbi:tRNA modification GTPase GTPBP3, mitochondrial isoform X2 [Planococcus citri]